MITAKAFIEKIMIPLQEKWGYIYGTSGIIWTKEKQAKSTRDMTVKYGSKWIGKMVTDCSGLIRWALRQLGGDIVHHARYQYTDASGNKGKLINGKREDGGDILPGTAVFLQETQNKIHHVGIYIGGGVCVEAKGTVYGVVTSKLTHWDHWGELKAVDYTDAAALETETPLIVESQEDAMAGTIIQALVNNPQKFLNVRSGPNSSAPVLFKVDKGATVEVLDAGEPDWWQIRYGGRVGWAYARYLKPLETKEEPKPDPEDIKTVLETIKATVNGLVEEFARLGELIAKTF